MSAILEAVQPETAQMIATQAKLYGLSVDDYLKQLLGMTIGNVPVANSDKGEFIQVMEKLAEDGLAPLPRNFSREDIYFSED